MFLLTHLINYHENIVIKYTPKISQGT